MKTRGITVKPMVILKKIKIYIEKLIRFSRLICSLKSPFSFVFHLYVVDSHSIIQYYVLGIRILQKHF